MNNIDQDNDNDMRTSQASDSEFPNDENDKELENLESESVSEYNSQQKSSSKVTGKEGMFNFSQGGHLSGNQKNQKQINFMQPTYVDDYHDSYEEELNNYFIEYFSTRISNHLNGKFLIPIAVQKSVQGQFKQEKDFLSKKFLLEQNQRNNSSTALASSHTWTESIDFDNEWCPKFQTISGLTANITDYTFEKMQEYFYTVFNPRLFKAIQDETNKAANDFFQRNPEIRTTSKYYYSQWKNLEPRDVQLMLACIIHQGAIKLPYLQMYWSLDTFHPTELKDIVSKAKFFLFIEFLSLADKQNQKTTDSAYQLYCINLVYELTSLFFYRLFFPFEHISISDYIIKGRLPFNPKDKRNNQKKHVPLDADIRVLLFSDCRTGYVFYAQAVSGMLDQEALENSILKVLDSHKGKGHKVFTAESITSISLAVKLAKLGFAVTGRISPNSRDFPNIDTKSKMHSKELRFFQSGNLLITQMILPQFSAIPIFYLSNNHTPQRINTEFDDQVPAVHAFFIQNFIESIEYTKYAQDDETLCSWRRAFFLLVSLAVTNTFIIYRLHNRKKYYEFAQMRQLLTKQMIEDYCKEDEVLLKKNPFKAPLTEAKKVKEFDEAEILTHTIAKCERKDCKFCSNARERKRTMYQCIECDIPLCQTGCFTKFHELLAHRKTSKKLQLERMRLKQMANQNLELQNEHKNPLTQNLL